jgi:hypothetical protein
VLVDRHMLHIWLKLMHQRLYAPPGCTHAFRPYGGKACKACKVLHWNSPGGHERLAVAQKRLAQEGCIGPKAQRKIREDHDYIFHDDERYRRAAR